MDFAEPLQALIPGATGRVLGVLVHTTKPLSGRTIARLAGISPAQAARVLPKLVELGVVESQLSPPSILYVLVPEHVATKPLLALAGLALEFVQQLGNEIQALRPVPACVAAYGSFARHQARADSDIDLLVVRPRGIDQDDEAWADVIEAVRATARRLSGNQVNILETAQSDVRRLIRSNQELWHNIVRDAVVIHGRPLNEL
jgi:predicted nucleotidyltransferase